MKIGIFLRNLDEILSEFHEHAPNVKNFQFLEKKMIKFFEKSVKISEMFKLFRKLFKLIQSCP